MNTMSFTLQHTMTTLQLIGGLGNYQLSYECLLILFFKKVLAIIPTQLRCVSMYTYTDADTIYRRIC